MENEEKKEFRKDEFYADARTIAALLAKWRKFGGRDVRLKILANAMSDANEIFED